MGIARFLTTPCTISTPSSDPDDSSTDDEGVPQVAVDTTDTMCHLQPYNGREGEQVLGVDQASRARRAWFASGTVLRFTSVVTVGDDRYHVHGDPDDWSVGSDNDHIDTVLIRNLRPGEDEGASA